MPRASVAEILRILDQGARDFVFPMLDNGYVYLAASRLSLYASPDDWALVFEIFGFSPRAGIPDLMVTAFTGSPVHTQTEADYVSAEAYQNYLRFHANFEQTVLYPIDDESWIDDEDGERVSASASFLPLRGKPVPVPAPSDYASAGIVLQQPPRPFVFELTRALAFRDRDAVLATEDERRTNLQPDLQRILLLDDWHHPNVVDLEALPSGTETFRQLAEVAASGDTTHYRPSEPPNTHWSNWPDGGTL
jgi:hypothetical protein